jgi:copper(I)-binding protein
MRWFLSFVVFVAMLGQALDVLAAGQLSVAHAWIRAMPPTTTMLAGYGELRNTGDSPLTLVAAHSKAFAEISVHESVERDGVVQMRPIEGLVIAPGAAIGLQPGGKHLMLMRSQRELATGDCVDIELECADGSRTMACFEIRADAPKASDH